MKNYLPAFACLSVLLAGSSEIYASEFILHDPNERANFAMDCRATRYVQSQLQQSNPFHLHLDVNFAEKHAVISPETGHNEILMALTSIATLPNHEYDYLVFTNGSASAIVNTKREDIAIVSSTNTGLEEYVIIGRTCKTTLTN